MVTQVSQVSVQVEASLYSRVCVFVADRPHGFNIRQRNKQIEIYQSKKKPRYCKPYMDEGLRSPALKSPSVVIFSRRLGG